MIDCKITCHPGSGAGEPAALGCLPALPATAVQAAVFLSKPARGQEAEVQVSENDLIW